MQNDSTDQAMKKNIAWSIKIEGQKLKLEAADTITYRGELEIPPFIDIELIKEYIIARDYKISSKTTSKMIVKVQVITIELKSEESIRAAELIAEIKKWQEKAIELEEKIQLNLVSWQEVNLAGTEQFDIKYEYRIQMSNGYICCPISITQSTLYHMFNSASVYGISSGSKTKESGGNTVLSIKRRKVI